jgi:signal transduction histidine kinase/DNA-binding response OmpR family regulator
MALSSSISVLHLEDSDLDAEFVRVRLERSGLAVAVERVSDRKEFVARLQSQRYDLILSDYQVPTFEGLAALELARIHQPDTPFLFVSGAMGEELAVEALKQGATDYVLKDRLTRLPMAVERALAEARERAERRKAEEALRAAEERFAFVRRSSGVGFWYCDLPLDVLEWDERVKLHFHLPPDARVTIQTFYERLHPDDREPTRQAIEHSIAAHAPYDVDYRTVDPASGAERWVRAIGRTFYAPDGTPARFDGVTIDVTAQKRAQAERERLLKAAQEARDEAEMANRMKDEFLATLSHELRTPLNAIVGWTKILRSTKVDDEDREAGLEVIDRNARAQAQLIEDLLDISRIISGKLTLDVQRVSLHEVIEGALAAVMPAADAKGVRVHKVLDSLAGPISGDPNRLQQAVWNLLTNAVKFTPRGGKIQVLLERVNSHVEISVIDTGQGIHPDFLPHVFDRFRQADGSTTRRHGGLGLGLSIVKQLVELHGGSVRVKSPGEGQGATFVLALPITVVHPEQPPRANARVLNHDPADEDACGDSDLGGLRVLVVDDEADARALMSRVLHDCGAEVRTAGSFQEAIDLLDPFHPEILVSDIGMPEHDGYDLIRQVRTRLSARQLPAVALTAFARSEDRMRAMRAGFQVHVAKPVDPEELVAVVASLAARTGGNPEERKPKT